jgi:hypothetical protein
LRLNGNIKRLLSVVIIITTLKKPAGHSRLRVSPPSW